MLPLGAGDEDRSASERVAPCPVGGVGARAGLVWQTRDRFEGGPLARKGNDMAVRRSTVLLATLAISLIGLVAVSAPAGADGLIVASATSVPVGGSFTVEVEGCDEWAETEFEYRYQTPMVTFLSGESGSERSISLGGVTGRRVTVPSWVDPDDPAVLRGVCMEQARATTSPS